MMNQQISEPSCGILEEKLIEVLDEFGVDVPRREYGAMYIVDAKRSLDSVRNVGSVDTMRKIVRNHGSRDSISMMWARTYAKVANDDRHELTRRGKSFCYTQDFEKGTERVEFVNYENNVANVAINYCENKGLVEVEFIGSGRKITHQGEEVLTNLVETCVRANYD